MTLEEKAEEWLKNNLHSTEEDYKIAYLAGAEEVKADCDFALEGKDVEIMELKKQIEKMKEVIAELIAITDKEICKECDCGIHCSECNVNHAQTCANHFLNGELKE